jgi:4-carboxymuconolactone decarboxylase
MLHQPRLAEPAKRLGEFLRYNTSLAPRLSELAIVIVARHWGSDFEWYQHAAITLRSGVSGQVIEAIRLRPVPPALQSDEQTVYEFTRSLLERHRVEDALYDQTKVLLGIVGVVELTGLIGY